VNGTPETTGGPKTRPTSPTRQRSTESHFAVAYESSACTRQRNVIDPAPFHIPQFDGRSSVCSRSVHTGPDALPDGHDSSPSTDGLMAHGLHFSMALRRFLDSCLIRRKYENAVRHVIRAASCRGRTNRQSKQFRWATDNPSAFPSCPRHTGIALKPPTNEEYHANHRHDHGASLPKTPDPRRPRPAMPDRCPCQGLPVLQLHAEPARAPTHDEIRRQAARPGAVRTQTPPRPQLPGRVSAAVRTGGSRSALRLDRQTDRA